MRQSGQEKSLENWDHQTILSQFIKEGTTVQMVRGQQRRGKMDQRAFCDGKKYRDTIGGLQKHSTLVVGVAEPFGTIDDYVKHRFRERSQDADHMADLEAEGTWKITVEGMKNSETWKAVRGSWTVTKRTTDAVAVVS